MARKPTETVQLKLRFPERLRRRIEQAAERNRHSMNAEIVERLEQSFQKEDELDRDTKLAQKAADATVSTLVRLIEPKEDWRDRWEGRLKDADVVNLMDKLREKLREEARRQSPAKTEQQTNKPTGTGDKS
jgi:non-homologous end joining protein Ku